MRQYAVARAGQDVRKTLPNVMFTIHFAICADCQSESMNGASGPSVWVTVLAGGSGLRFWPLSRADRPKQLLPLGSARPLIVDTIERLRGLAPPERTRILAGEDLVAADPGSDPACLQAPSWLNPVRGVRDRCWRGRPGSLSGPTPAR